MKKNFIKKIATLALSVVMLGSVVACGGKKTLEEASKKDSSTFDQIASTYSSAFGSSMDVDLKVKENSIIMTIAYDDDLDVTEEAAQQGIEAIPAASMEQSLDQIASGYKLKASDLSWIVKFTTEDGEVLAEKEFKGK